MSKRVALGKGLGALMPTQGRVAVRVSDVPLKEIIANKHQPRKFFSDESLKELSASIKESGVIQPVLLQKLDKGYELIAGERRFRASKLAGLTTIPALVKNVGEVEALELAIIENIQREELNPLEEATAYKNLMDGFGLTQEKVAKKVGRTRPAVANMLRLLKLPASIQKDVGDGKLTMSHARALLACGTDKEMLDMRKQILEYGLNVREVEAKAGKKKKASAKSKKSINPALQRVADAMQKKLSTKVKINPKKKSGGEIVIEYYSQEDLDRIMESIGI